MKRQLWMMLLGIMVLSVGTAAVAAPLVDTLDNYVIGAGGDKTVAGGYELTFTLGQPVVGEFEVGTNEFCSGYWCETEWRTYVPVVLRNN